MDCSTSAMRRSSSRWDMAASSRDIVSVAAASCDAIAASCSSSAASFETQRLDVAGDLDLELGFGRIDGRPGGGDARMIVAISLRSRSISLRRWRSSRSRASSVAVRSARPCPTDSGRLEVGKVRRQLDALPLDAALTAAIVATT